MTRELKRTWCSVGVKFAIVAPPLITMEMFGNVKWAYLWNGVLMAGIGIVCDQFQKLYSGTNPPELPPASQDTQLAPTPPAVIPLKIAPKPAPKGKTK